MTTKKTTKIAKRTPAPEETFAQKVAAEVTQAQTTGDSLGLGDAVSPEDRAALRARIRPCTVQLITAMASFAKSQGGAILGTAFDSDQATTVVARLQPTADLASANRQLAQRAEDDFDGQLAEVSDKTMAILALMKRSRRTKEGKLLASKYKELRALAPTTKGTKKAPAAAPAATQSPAVAAPVTSTPAAPASATPRPAPTPGAGQNGSGSSST